MHESDKSLRTNRPEDIGGSGLVAETGEHPEVLALRDRLGEFRVELVVRAGVGRLDTGAVRRFRLDGGASRRSLTGPARAGRGRDGGSLNARGTGVDERDDR